MTHDDIIRMAREAGWVIRDDLHYMDHQAIQDALIERIEQFAALVAAAEREACARVCEAEGLLWGQRYADAIRARGEK